MKTAVTFIFDSYRFDQETGQITFQYSNVFDNGTQQPYTTTLKLPADRPVDWKGIPSSLQDTLFQTLHLLQGIDYWKMYCAPHIEIQGYAISKEQAQFWNTLYTKGLGQFFYENNIDFRGLVQFPFQPDTTPHVTPFPRTDRSLVPIGGGKDSLTTIEILRQHYNPFELYSLGSSTIQDQTARVSGQSYLHLTRTLDPKMIELSKTDEVYNGHVPISASYLFSGLLAAMLYDFRYLVFSNEHSANIGNVAYLGLEVNHQWSKSLEFEKMAQDYIHTFITPDITPFSLLRPLSELEIVRRFCQHPEYFHSFSSCNRNFVISKPRPDSSQKAYWCGECPKCAFVFMCVSAFLPKATVVEMLGKNLYADEKLIPLFRELLGVAGFKPFECVGTPEEARVACCMAQERGEYTGDVVMSMFERDVLPSMQNIDELKQHVFTIEDASTLPEEFQTIL